MQIINELIKMGDTMYPITRDATPEEEAAMTVTEQEQPVSTEPTAAELAAQIADLQEALNLLLSGATE